MLAEEYKVGSINKLSIILGVKREYIETVAKNKSSEYKPYETKKRRKDGSIKVRKIDNPSPKIKAIQKRINKFILQPECETLPKYITGSIRKRSIIDNARPHVGNKYMSNLDITDCFPSINSSAVYRIFIERFGYSPPVANLLSKLTTYGNRLPQGSPSSPGLCNFALAPSAISINEYCLAKNVAFSIYIDDITLSSNDLRSLVDCEKHTIQIITKAGFHINKTKTKHAGINKQKRTTGIITNHRIGAGRAFIDQLKREILAQNKSPRIIGKIAHLRQTNPAVARKLKHKINSSNDNNVSK